RSSFCVGHGYRQDEDLSGHSGGFNPKSCGQPEQDECAMMQDLEQPHAATGAQPAGAIDEKSAGAAVRDMFDGIAGRYDLLNHVLSANVDRLWWWRAARTFRDILRRNDARVLDLCCGTGDMAL